MKTALILVVTIVVVFLLTLAISATYKILGYDGILITYLHIFFIWEFVLLVFSLMYLTYKSVNN